MMELCQGIPPLPIPESKWESVSLDFLKLPKSVDGNDTLVVFVDRLTKMIHVVASCGEGLDAPSVAQLYFSTVVRHHGVPTSLISDRDTRFTSQFWRTLAKLCGTKLAMSTANHPQSDGQTERANRTIIEMLRGYCAPLGDRWDRHLVSMEFAYNDSVHPSTGVTPFYFNSGQHPRVPQALISDKIVPSTSVNPMAESVFEVMRKDLHRAREQLLKAQARMKASADKLRRPSPGYKVGDLVLVASKTLRTPEAASRHKLFPKYVGPFPISQQIAKDNFQVALPNYLKRVHPTFHVSVLKPFIDGSEEFPDRDPVPRAPFSVNDAGEELFLVERLLRRRKVGRKWQFEVKWLGYDKPEDNTWEDRSRLMKDVPLLVSEFEEQFS